MQPTLKDVARHSGFSIATVSRVLSGSDYPISPEAKAGIQQAANELGYVPNMMARALKTNASKEVAVVIPSIMNLFYSAIVMGVEEALASTGYSMLIYLTEKGIKVRDVLTSIRGKRISGVIIAADCVSEQLLPHIQQLRREKIPVVVTDLDPNVSEPFYGVFFDYREGCRQGVNYLLRHGHRNIAFLTMTIDRTSRERRLMGYQDAMRGYGIEPKPENVFISGNPSGFEAGQELVNLMLASGRSYTAVMVNNDAVAVGVLNELTRHNLRVPEDISVMGFDDSVFAEMSYPKLTTVRVDAEAIGRKACEFVLREQAGEKISDSIYLKPQIIERQSTRAL